MTDSLTKGMIGMTHTPAGQSLGIAGSALLVAPQKLELMQTLVAAARHQPMVRKNLSKIVDNYTIVPRGQSLAWQTEPEMEHLKLQCQTEAFMDSQYQALRENCSDGFRGAAPFYTKFSTLYQVSSNGTIRKAIDYDGTVSAAVGITPRSHDLHTPDDMTNEIPQQEAGKPYKIPNLMARRILRHNTMALDRPGPPGQGAYNSGGITNVITTNGVSPMAIAKAEGGHVSREISLSGPAGHFVSNTTAATIEAERETVSVEPKMLEKPFELVSTMQRSLRLRPLQVTLEFRALLKPFKYKVHLQNPKTAYTQGRTVEFPFDVIKMNAFSPLPTRHLPRTTQYNNAASFVNYCTSYDQFKVFMLRYVTIKIGDSPLS